MATCTVCDDSGETVRHSGIYDCQAPGCISASLRTKLEAHIIRPSMHVNDALWLGYRAGMQSSLMAVATVCDAIAENLKNVADDFEWRGAEQCAAACRKLLA